MSFRSGLPLVRVHPQAAGCHVGERSSDGAAGAPEPQGSAVVHPSTEDFRTAHYHPGRTTRSRHTKGNEAPSFGFTTRTQRYEIAAVEDEVADNEQPSNTSAINLTDGILSQATITPFEDIFKLERMAAASGFLPPTFKSFLQQPQEPSGYMTGVYTSFAAWSAFYCLPKQERLLEGYLLPTRTRLFPGRGWLIHTIFQPIPATLILSVRFEDGNYGGAGQLGVWEPWTNGRSKIKRSGGKNAGGARSFARRAWAV
eukprot:1176939-Prorocentrum_minimum.AAC.1